MPLGSPDFGSPGVDFESSAGSVVPSFVAFDAPDSFDFPLGLDVDFGAEPEEEGFAPSGLAGFEPWSRLVEFSSADLACERSAFGGGFWPSPLFGPTGLPPGAGSEFPARGRSADSAGLLGVGSAFGLVADRGEFGSWGSSAARGS